MSSWLDRLKGRIPESIPDDFVPPDYPALEQSLRKAIEADSQDWLSMLDLGDALLRQEKFKDAARVYGAAAELKPDSARAWGSMAKVLCYLGNFEGSREYLTKAIEQDSETASAQVALGLVAYKDSKLKIARRHFEHAARLDPLDTDAWFHLGQISWELKDMRQCAEAFGRSLQLDPGNMVALRTMGNAYVAMKKYPEALEAYREAAEIDPTVETTFFGIGTLLVKLGRTDEAIAAFERATEIDPSYGEAWEAIAEIRSKT